jgi:hypothetical protein
MAAVIGATCAYGLSALGNTLDKAFNGCHSEAIEAQDEEIEKKTKASPRTEPIDLEEQLALEEAKGAEGKKVGIKQKDPRYPETDWKKQSHNHEHPDGTKTEIHWWENLHNGNKHGYKFKDKTDNAKSRFDKWGD